MARILVVEDEPSLALGLQEDLSIEGYEVEVARDGETALQRALAGSFDLIVLDVMLPKKDGFEVCRQLRREGARVPILMLTAKTQESDKVLGLEIGADDYVTKPFSGRELRARIKALLRRTVGDVADIYRFGDVEVDFARCELRRGGEVVEVTPVEIKMLAAFVRQPGRVLTRDQILSDVWGRGTFVTDRVVDAHVVNLRRKIEPVATDPRYLVSVRGIGYRFDPE
jgi:two-component system alkaline phosphatase synthesis response regulator PhoP